MQTKWGIIGAEVNTMERITEQLGFLSVSDAFALLTEGTAVYIASAPEASGALPLRGGWKDDEGNLPFEVFCVYLSKEDALTVANAFGQKFIIALTPNPEPKGRVYLLQDTVRNRVLSLRYVGLYISDGTHLMTAVADGELPFEPVGEVQSLPADISFPSTDTPTHTHAGAGGRGRRRRRAYRAYSYGACSFRACPCRAY